VAGSGFTGGARPKGRCAGAVVSFDVAEVDDVRTAEEVAFIPDVAPRRARRRHAGIRAMR
jgi:hypothetical protein